MMKGKRREGDEYEETDALYLEVKSYAGEPAHNSRRAEVEWPSFAGLLLNALLYLVTCLILLPFSFYTVEPQQHALVLFWGSLVKVAKKPGPPPPLCHCALSVLVAC
jgi:hypothetical protein